jgi:hypothetical protein
MSQSTADILFKQITELPLPEQLKLQARLAAKLQAKDNPRVKYVDPIPVPDPIPNQRWMTEHAHEYGGQWVALDSGRLIAHGPNAAEVYAAADADGAYLPLVTYIVPADAPPFAGI